MAQWCDATAAARHFADPLVRPELERNGLLADLANSFLIEATRDAAHLPAPRALATSFALHRAKRFQTVTRLVPRPAGGYEIVKASLFPDAAAATDGPVRQVLDPAPHVAGEKLSLEMLRAWPGVRCRGPGCVPRLDRRVARVSRCPRDSGAGQGPAA